METNRNKKILIADGVSPQQFSIGSGEKTTLTSSENGLEINKPVTILGTATISEAINDNNAVTKGQLEGRIQDVINLVESGNPPFLDINILSSDFIAVSNRYRYTISRSKYGYLMASIGFVGELNSDGTVTTVEYDSEVQQNGDIDVYISTSPFNAVIRVILGGLDPNYVDFANQFDQVNAQIQILQNQISDIIGGESTVIYPPVYYTTVYESEWESVGNYYTYTILKSVHKIDNPFIDSLLVYVNSDNSYENAVYSYKVYTDDRIVITVDTQIRCIITVRSRIYGEQQN